MGWSAVRYQHQGFSLPHLRYESKNQYPVYDQLVQIALLRAFVDGLIDNDLKV